VGLFIIIFQYEVAYPSGRPTVVVEADDGHSYRTAAVAVEAHLLRHPEAEVVVTDAGRIHYKVAVAAYPCLP
jgi:hypothetical protein